MQPRRGQIHRGQAHIPRRDAYLVIRPEMAIQHKGNAAGIERCVSKSTLMSTRDGCAELKGDGKALRDYLDRFMMQADFHKHNSFFFVHT